MGDGKKMNKQEREKLNSIYWKIRRNYPLGSWHNPKTEFEKVMREVLEEFGDVIRK